MLARGPLFGVGYGKYAEMFWREGYFPQPKSAHSSIIEIGVELGLIGLGMYAWILFAVHRGGLRVFKDSEIPIDRVLGLGVLSATICLFLLDLTGTRFTSGNIMAYYWILAGLTLNVTPNPSGTAARQSVSPVGGPSAILAAFRGLRRYRSLRP
jgi:O-antigen ligase